MGFSYGYKKGGSKPTAPAESVTILPSRTQVVELGIPHLTPRAVEIRNCVNFKVLTEKGERMYFFNGDTEKWTNISLKSTDENPILSSPPVAAVEKAYNMLSRCPAVSKVTIMDEHGQTMTMDQVRAMDFIPLEEQAAAAAEELNDEDDDSLAEAVVDLQGLTEKQAELIEKQTGEIVNLKTELGVAAAKQARAEVDIQKLVEKMDNMQAVVNHLGVCVNEVHEWAASVSPDTTTSDSPADAPADPPADAPTDSDPSSSTPVPAAAKPKSKPNRLEAAAAKKRRMTGGGTAATIDVTNESDEDVPLTKSTTRKRSATKAK